MSDKHAQMREMARGLIRDSVIEDAIAQKIAQIVEFIHEDRIKPLEAKLAKAEVIVRIIASAEFDERIGEAVDLSCEYLAELEGDKP